MASTPHEASPYAARPAGDANGPTIGRLVSDATEQVSSIVRNEIALAKKEITVDVKKGGMGAAFFAGAAFLALMGLIFLLHTLAQGISTAFGWPLWPGYGIVTLLLFIGAAVLALLGKGKISQVKGKPERTIVTTKETVEAVKDAASS